MIDREVPFGFGGIEFNTGGLNSILEGYMLVLGSGGLNSTPGVQFNPSPETKNQEPRLPQHFSGNLGLGSRGGVEFNPPQD